jgi:AraC family transcriptional regulator, arabinose operon regulatory protein
VKNDSIRSAQGHEFQIALPADMVASFSRTQPLLRGLLATGAGFSPKGTHRFRNQPECPHHALLMYCVRGSGWCEFDGRLRTVYKGDVLVLPPNKPHSCGAQPTSPWMIHWVRATGELLPNYLEAIPGDASNPVHSVGDDLQLVRLFSEIFDSLRSGTSFDHLLRASAALAHLLSLLIRERRANPRENSDAANKVAEAIIYMSDHLDESLRVPALARMASLSPAYFGALFKEQTGCSPRNYVHLLRIHRACQLLQDTQLSVKEIASRLGYLDQFHFSRQFKAFQSLSPSDYRHAQPH